MQNQPEDCAEPTGRLRQNQPEGASRDLSSKNYPEELSREEEGKAPSFSDALQDKETHFPVQAKVQNFEPKGSTTHGRDQAETVGQFQESNVPPPPPKVGVVTYKQHPESIDLSELWEIAEYEAKAKSRALAPGHKHPALVAHGLGAAWIGPNASDFDERLLALIAKNKKSGNHPDNRAACVTFITRAIRDADWAKIEALWLEVQQKTRQQPVLVVIDTPPPKKEAKKYSPPPIKNWAKSILGARYQDAG